MLAVASLLVCGAAPAAAATQIEVQAGFDGFAQPGAPVVVRVRVRADRLVRARLHAWVSAPGAPRSAVNLAVEVPGGSVKEYLVAAPNPGFGGGGFTEARAELLEGERVVASGQDAVQTVDDQELVGLLAGVLAGRPAPPPAPLAVDAGTARFVSLGDDELAVPAVLDGLDVIGATATDLDALGPDRIAGLLAWVDGGGQLLVDIPVGQAVPGVPEQWQPGGDGRSAAGMGEVRAVGGAMVGGRWAGLVEPTPLDLGSTSFSMGEPVDRALARDAGLTVPRLGWLIGFLGAYVLAVVPITLTVLRRIGRGELGWLVLPMAALVFAGGAWGAGRNLRSDVWTGHATALRMVPGGAQATTSLGTASPGGGAVRTSFPPGWVVERTISASSALAVPLETEITGRGPASVLRLQTGQFAVHNASGPAAPEGGLEVAATSPADGRASGTVRNTLPFALEEVAVLVDAGGTKVGRLDAGEERSWEVRSQPHVPDPQFGMIGVPELRMWGEAAGFTGRPDRDGVVNFSLWESTVAAMPSGFRSAGTAVAAGWTRAYRPEIDVTTETLQGRTVVVARSPVRPEGVALTDVSVRTELVRGPVMETTGGGVATTDTSDGRPVVRFVLPDPDQGAPLGPATPLAVAAPIGQGVEVWAGDRWQPTPASASGEHPVPTGAVRDGVVWARSTPAGFGGGPDPRAQQQLRLKVAG